MIHNDQIYVPSLPSSKPWNVSSRSHALLDIEEKKKINGLRLGIFNPHDNEAFAFYPLQSNYCVSIWFSSHVQSKKDWFWLYFDAAWPFQLPANLLKMF